ncbi:MAG: hypothetical protein ABSG59_24615 [Verrucomicrobiota bacterium]|jgi:hypothetical protein
MNWISLDKARRSRFARRQNPGAIIEWLIYFQWVTRLLTRLCLKRTPDRFMTIVIFTGT